MSSPNKSKQEEIGVVFLHGVGLRGSVWREAASRLSVPCLLADFPLRNESDEKRMRQSLEDYISDLQRQIEEWGCRRFILVAHSISGVLSMELARRFPGRVAGLAAVGAIIPANGGSFLSSLPIPQRWILSVILRLAGTKPPEPSIRKGLCSDLVHEQTEAVVSGFLPESKQLYTERTHAPIPADIPKMYIKLTEDKEVLPALQERMIANLKPEYIEELATGHLPMLSDSNGLSRVIERMLAHAASHEPGL